MDHNNQCDHFCVVSLLYIYNLELLEPLALPVIFPRSPQQVIARGNIVLRLGISPLVTFIGQSEISALIIQHESYHLHFKWPWPLTQCEVLSDDRHRGEKVPNCEKMWF